MRSALTTLGILIGVSAVIILLSVGTGSSAAVKKSISQLGTNTLTVSRSANGNGRAGAVGAGGFAGARGGGGLAGAGLGGGFGGGGFAGARGGGAAGSSNTGSRIRNTYLTLDDALALTDPNQVPDVIAVAPVLTATSVTATYEGVTQSVSQFIGTAGTYFGINNYSLVAGGYFTDAQYTSHADVAVLGYTMAENLFGNVTSAVGKTVQFNDKDFVVVGVLKAKGASANSNSDAVVIAPLTSVANNLTGPVNTLESISVQAGSQKALDAAQAEIETVLDSRHKVTATTRDYTVQNQAAILETATSSSKTLTVLLGAVAAISLLVGGIGVMNIMLVTVTERTREIGIRKAIGAGRLNIVTQFLAEAVVLSVLGGLVGVAIGLIGSRFTIVGIQPVVETWTVLLAFGVAVLTGLFFGIYPANRASRLRPIDALRYE
ncbi:ABC transporter permease [Jatrophihabitans sp. DSM 45814]